MQKYFLKMEKMKNLSKDLLSLLVAIILLSGCQNLKDGLSGDKKSNSDEFLIEKKSPLVLPPEFSQLPKPESLNNEEKHNQGEIDLMKIFKKEKSSTNVNLKNKKNSSLENSIIDKIKNN